ncbi:MAG: bile acid:sodium symporter [Hahellaceae bacterium]|nr:bile acid:sodium symporter [Hahellaceae bacterium]MCP5168868.1 bile acid:sodium symporter [Hahellaceae bacterium]
MIQSTATQWVAPALIATMMLGMGMAMVPNDIRRIWQQPGAVFFGSLAQLILLPLIGLGLALAFNLPPVLAAGLMILTFCPGGVGSNMFSLLARGDAALSVTLTFISSSAIVLTLPTLVNAALAFFMETQTEVSLPVTDTIVRVFFLTLVPVAIGMTIRQRYPERALRAQGIVKWTGFTLMGLLVAGVILKEWQALTAYAHQAGWVSLTLCSLAMLTGFTGARLLRLSRPQATTIAIEVGMQNSALAILISTLLDMPELAIPAIIYTAIVSALCLIWVIASQWRWPGSSRSVKALQLTSTQAEA